MKGRQLLKLFGGMLDSLAPPGAGIKGLLPIKYQNQLIISW
jgi:hypothetical protein